MRADDVRHVVQQTRQVPGHVRVPGVGVHQVGAGAVLRDLQVHPERGQGRVRARQLGRHVVAGHPLGVPGAVEAAHPDIGVPTQHRGQLGDVDTRAAVDVRGVLAGEQVDAHDATLARRRRPGVAATEG